MGASSIRILSIMTLITLVMVISDIQKSAASVSTYKQKLYRRFPRIAWSGCDPVISLSLTKCSIKCLQMGFECLGFNFLKDQTHSTLTDSTPITTTNQCSICSSNQTVSSLESAPLNGMAMYFSYDMDSRILTQGTRFSSHFQNGLHHGQVLLFDGTMISSDVNDLFLIIADKPFFHQTGGTFAESDLYIHLASPVDLARPNSIIIDNFNSLNQVWVGPKHTKLFTDYVSSDADDIVLLIFITETNYRIFINDLFLLEYPHSHRKKLSDFKYIDSTFQSILQRFY